MRSQVLSLAVLIAGASSMGACEADVEPVTERTGGSTCPQWRCGFNAAEINGHSLQSLDADVTDRKRIDGPHIGRKRECDQCH